MKQLFPWLQERCQKAISNAKDCTIEYYLPKDPEYFLKKINIIDSLDGVKSMVELALQLHISHIGFAIESNYDSIGVLVDNNIKYDPQSIRPLLLSLALAEPLDRSKGRIYRFVIDLRKPELFPELRKLFRLPVCFCGHHTKMELFCLWKLGLSEPNILWDTYIFERALSLGRYNHKYQTRKATDEVEKIQAKKNVKEIQKFNLSLNITCQRYGVPLLMGADRERLQKVFIDHRETSPFIREQIEYSAEKAVAAARLYLLHVQEAAIRGLLYHCQTVEMPWVITSARIEWVGVRIDSEKCKKIVAQITPVKEALKKYITAKFRIDNVESRNELKQYFNRLAILEKFQRNGDIKFDKDTFKENLGLHQSIPYLGAARRAMDILSNINSLQKFVTPYGRVSADHIQLGADTGRQTSISPNITGIDRMSRPVIIPDNGNGIGEVDWSQVEVGVAAAVYGDNELIRMFNSGDVYSAMAQNFFKNDLPESDRNIPGNELSVTF